MRRLFGLLTIVIFAGLATAASAQEPAAWPVIPVDGSAWRGPGGYLSVVKIMTCWLVFLAWVKTTDWVNCDAQRLHLPYLKWNPIVFGPFLAAMVLLWIVPWFWFGLVVLLAAYAGPLAAYVVFRDRQPGVDQKIISPEYWRGLSSKYLGKVGVKVAAQRADPLETGPAVKLTPRADSERELNLRLMSARHSAGYKVTRRVIADALVRRAMAIMFDCGSEEVTIRHMVDGVWLDGEVLAAPAGNPVVETLKLLCGLNPDDRQARQEGRFSTEYNDMVRNGILTTQGVSSGERAVIQFEFKKTQFETLEDLGLRPKQLEQVKELIKRDHGFLLFSAIPGGGLRSTMNVVLRQADRFTREFAALEEEGNRYEEVENITICTYSNKGGDPPQVVLEKLLRTEPNVVIVRDMANAQVVSTLARNSLKERLVFSTMRAKDGPEALLRVLALKVPPVEFARAITAVTNQRLIRKLCEKCKEAYTPPPQVLKQLGIAEGKVTAFYRPPEPKPEDEKKKKKPIVCPACGGVGYVGRTAIVELLVVDDTVRKVLATTPKLDLIRQAARKAGMLSLQEEGMLLVANGVTSLAELARALK